MSDSIRSISFQRFVFLMIIVSEIIAFFYQSELYLQDIGNVLYNAELISNGSIPYREFECFYGPLPLYYYAGLFKLLGSSINTAYLGWCCIFFFTVAIFYFLLQKLVNPWIAFGFGLWFSRMIYFGIGKLVFAVNLNHIFASILIVFYISFLLHWFYSNQKHIIGCFMCIILLILVKYNIGLSLLLSHFIIMWLWHYYKKIDGNTLKKSLIGIVISLFVFFALYGYYYYPFLFSDSGHAGIKRYFLSHAVNKSPFWSALDITNLITNPIYYFLNHSYHVLFYYHLYIMLFLVYMVARLIMAYKTIYKQKTQIALFDLTFLICFLFLSHEFFIAGVPYSNWFSWPIMLLIISVHWNQYYQYFIRYKWISRIMLVIPVILGSFMVSTIFNKHFFRYTDRFYINSTKGKVHVMNTPSIKNLLNLCEFVNKKTLKDDFIYVIQYQSIIYFLTNRKNGAYRDILNHMTFIDRSMEEEIIQSLEKNHTKIIISYKVVPSLYPELWNYIMDHYLKIQSFIAEPWSSEYHVYRRKI